MASKDVPQNPKYFVPPSTLFCYSGWILVHVKWFHISGKERVEQKGRGMSDVMNTVLFKWMRILVNTFDDKPVMCDDDIGQYVR